MPRTAQARLIDMRDALAGIGEILAATEYEAFEASWMLQRAVERGLEIISEASRALPADLNQQAPDLPWPQIAAIGNVLRHEYQRVEPRIVWNIAREHLPNLEVAVRDLLDDLV